MVWKQLTYTNEQELRSSLTDLVTVGAENKYGQFNILGTAFPIMSVSKHVVLMTASHIIEHAYKQSRRAQSERIDLRHLPGPDNEPYQRTASWVKEDKELKCSFVVGDDIVMVPVEDICLRPPLDMAILVVKLPTEGKPLLVFQINSNPLEIGDKVVLTSYVTEGNKRNLVARMGNITAINASGSLVQAPLYSTNIPIEAGASGGPLFRFDGEFDGHKEVVGVVSSDFSTSEAFSNTSIDGDSRVSMICSAAPLQLTDPKIGPKTFQDLCEAGFINDSGDAMRALKLKYYPDGTWSQEVPTGRASSTNLK